MVKKAKLIKRSTVSSEPVDVAETAQRGMAKYKLDINAFSTPVDDGKDLISTLPSETLDQILSYCVLDHEPERAVRMQNEGYSFEERPHVLLSLAGMSSHFRGHVEDFSRREMLNNKESYDFKTNAELAAERRRSLRNHSPPRCYRHELVVHLQRFCVRCGYPSSQVAVMANAVKCCHLCQTQAFPGLIDLTTALREYDLRDWMLIPSREPGPRAKIKKTDLLPITYGTVRTGTPLLLGMVISYRFFRKDVKALARLVHGDLETHMKTKRALQVERRTKKRQETHRRLKVRYHEDELARAEDAESEERHRKRLDHYENPERDAGYDSDASDFGLGYGWYGDEHERLCQDKQNCGYCYDRATRKYHGW